MKEIDYIYRDRSDFCIIALTGYTSTGCSRLAKYMATSDFQKLDEVRNPVSLSIRTPKSAHNTEIFFNDSNSEIKQSISETIFNCKYSICYNFIQKRYKPFIIIKYSKVLLMMLLSRLCEKSSDVEIFREKLIEVIKDKYQPSTVYDQKYRELKNPHIWEDINRLLDGISLDNLFSELKTLTHEDLKDGEKYDSRNKMIADVFLGREGYDKFDLFYKEFTKRLFKTDY